jgi:hypothetical protein
MVSFAEFVKKNNLKQGYDDDLIKPLGLKYIKGMEPNYPYLAKSDLCVWVEEQIVKLKERRTFLGNKLGNKELAYFDYIKVQNELVGINHTLKFCEEMLATLKPCESLTKPRISCEKHSEGLK